MWFIVRILFVKKLYAEFIFSYSLQLIILYLTLILQLYYSEK